MQIEASASFEDDNLRLSANSDALHPLVLRAGSRAVLSVSGEQVLVEHLLGHEKVRLGDGRVVHEREVWPVDVGQSLVNVGRGLFKDEFKKSTARAGVLTMGYIFHLPARQAWLTGEYLFDWMNGDVDSFSPWELLVTGDVDE